MCFKTLILAEDISINGTTKTEKYEELLPQLKALVGNETVLVANLGNICAALKTTFDFFWIGFYLVQGDELVLGPFQGPVACTRIALGKGVCGTAWKEKQTLLVPNVDEFPGHIACSALSKSEIVIPILKNETVVGVLDVDSTELNAFDEIDNFYLEQICIWVASLI